MKKMIVLTALVSVVAFAGAAQETTGKAVKPAKTEKKVSKKEKTEKKNPSVEQRQHAEEKSNGHAFSGEGKGGDKNLKDPQKKSKKEKKPKKAKKEIQ